MTGGQMAPTTLPGMKSSTSPYGRDVKIMGNPLKMTDIVATLPGTYYVTRQSVHTPANVRKTKKAMRKAVQYQKLNKGTCFVEIVSNCPSGWKMTPVQSNKWMEENMFPFYPLGDLKVPAEENVQTTKNPEKND
jgi:2-oxoglutarate ferredoxin oxidoreductase subunit beta